MKKRKQTNSKINKAFENTTRKKQKQTSKNKSKRFATTHNTLCKKKTSFQLISKFLRLQKIWKLSEKSKSEVFFDL